MGAQGFGRRAGQRRALTGAPALMPELLVLALAAAGRVPDDGCFAAAAAHNVVVSKNIQDPDPGVDGQDLIGRTGGYAVGNWMVFSLMPTPFD